MYLKKKTKNYFFFTIKTIAIDNPLHSTPKALCKLRQEFSSTCGPTATKLRFPGPVRHAHKGYWHVVLPSVRFRHLPLLSLQVFHCDPHGQLGHHSGQLVKLEPPRKDPLRYVASRAKNFVEVQIQCSQWVCRQLKVRDLGPDPHLDPGRCKKLLSSTARGADSGGPSSCL